MAFTIVDWNVNGFALKGQVELFEGLDCDVALLQEVTRDTWPIFRELAAVGGVAFDNDAIYVSPECDVVRVEHQWDEVAAAGGDHAAVVATLEWARSTGPNGSTDTHAAARTPGGRHDRA